MKISPTVFLLLSILLGLTACGGSSSGSSSPASSGPNVYSNGYRLVKHTSEAFFRTALLVSEYEYQFDNGIIIKESYRQEPGSDIKVDVDTSQLNIDSAGRLIGGRYDYQLGITDYKLEYNDQGQVISFSESELDRFDFIYSNGRLEQIEHKLVDDFYIYDYRYNTDNTLQSVTDGLKTEVNVLLYDENNVVSGISKEYQSGGQINTYNFEYDSNGNLVTIERISPIGELFSTDRFEYVSSTETIFNHWIMRLAIEPFEMTLVDFVY